MDETFLHWLMADTFGAEDTGPTVPRWFSDAACAGHDTSLWFAGKWHTYAEASAVCDGCQVRAACLDHALDVEAGAGPTHRFGLWGGATPRERARLDQRAA